MADQPISPEIASVEGCDCGGLESHSPEHDLHNLDPVKARRAIDAANRRIQMYIAASEQRGT